MEYSGPECDWMSGILDPWLNRDWEGTSLHGAQPYVHCMFFWYPMPRVICNRITQTLGVPPWNRCVPVWSRQATWPRHTLLPCCVHIRGAILSHLGKAQLEDCGSPWGWRGGSSLGEWMTAHGKLRELGTQALLLFWFSSTLKVLEIEVGLIQSNVFKAILQRWIVIQSVAFLGSGNWWSFSKFIFYLPPF